MQVIENATQLKARLLEHSKDPERPGWLRLTVEVADTAPVTGLPSLVHAAAGETLTVLMPPSELAALESLAAGTAIGMQVRLRAPGVHTVVPGSLAGE